MRCLITGGAGFIGSHIQDKLLELGHEVAVVDNLRSGKKENIDPKSTFFEVDICDKQALHDAINTFKPDAIFHLAAQNDVPTSMKDPYLDQQINIVGMMNLLEAVKETKTKIIYSNTGGAYYGEVADEDLPVVEDYLVTKPTSFYGVSKLTAENYLRLYGVVFGLPWVSLRYANVYGPRQDGNKEAGVVAIFTTKLLNKEPPTINGYGEHTRDYIYVQDVVSANIAAMDYPENDAFNISTGLKTSTNQVFQTIESELKTGLTPTHGPDRPGDVRDSVLSNKKAQEKLNWQPRLTFQEGIHQTIQYYLTKK